jgi:integrase
MAWLYQRGDSKRWWIGFRSNGTQVLQSTGTEYKAQAQKQLEQVELMLGHQRNGGLTFDMFQQITGRTLPNMTLKAALDDWLNEARGAAGARTVEKYQTFADALAAHFHASEQGPLVATIAREALQSFLTAKRATVSAGTANMSRKCLAVFFRRCRSLGLIRENPVDGIKSFKVSREEKRVRRPFTLKELSGLYKQAPDDFWRYMVLAGFFTGLRLGDLVTMPVGAVDFKARTINLLTRKTGITMHIPIAPRLYSLLAELKRKRKGSSAADPFWPEHAKRYEKNGSGWFSQRFYDLLLVKAGIAKTRPHRPGTKSHSEKRKVNEVSFHCLRHSYVTTLAGLGHNQQIVKALAGHSSDEINDLYTKLPAEVLAPAVALLPDITKARAGK